MPLGPVGMVSPHLDFRAAKGDVGGMRLVFIGLTVLWGVGALMFPSIYLVFAVLAALTYLIAFALRR